MLESHHQDRWLSKVKVSLPEMEHISIHSYAAIHIEVSMNYFRKNKNNNCYKNNMPFKGHELQRKSLQLRNETCN
ncbi:hypothetical protein BT93_H2235 [Corymbia citriodora subsp. variegata]|nr:hypothetical protein BT93_H2235 [Corymbia citriodora subsp. variegata]